MGQVLHGSATTTEAIRRAIQHSQESLRALAKRYGVNQKTVRKWKGRSSVADIRTGPTQPRSTVLSGEEEAIVVAFRRHTLLSLDDCLYALQPTIPHLTRSSLHRCLQRHGIRAACRHRNKATSLRRRGSNPIRSASSTSTSPKCRPPRASHWLPKKIPTASHCGAAFRQKRARSTPQSLMRMGKSRPLSAKTQLDFGEQAGVVTPEGTSAIADVGVGASTAGGALGIVAGIAGIAGAVGVSGIAGNTPPGLLRCSRRCSPGVLRGCKKSIRQGTCV